MYVKELKRLKSAVGSLWDILATYDAIIAGGAITSVFTNRPINDVDVYLRSKADLVALIEEIEGTQTRIVDYTKKSVLLLEGESKVQLVVFDYFQDAAAVFDAFDFTCVMGAFDMRADQFRFHPNFFYANAKRILEFHDGTRYPIVSLMRVQKYTSRGYKISQVELAKIALACMALEIDSYDMLLTHMGGMYGELTVEDVFDTQKPFSLDDALTQLENVIEWTPKVNKGTVDIAELLNDVAGVKTKYFEFQGRYHIVHSNGYIEPGRQLTNLMGDSDVARRPHLYEKIDPPSTIKVWKVVQAKDGDLLRSRYNNSFVYPRHGWVNCDSPKGLFWWHEGDNGAHIDTNNTAIVTANVDTPDILDWSTKEIRVRRAFITDVKIHDQSTNDIPY